MMKSNHKIALLAVCGALALSAGCGKTEVAVPPVSKDTSTPAEDASAQSKKAAEAQRLADSQRAAQAVQAAEAQKQLEAARVAEAQKQLDAMKAADVAKTDAALQRAAAEKLAAEQGAATTAQEKAQIQSLIDSVKSLTGQNKYAEALKIIAELANLKLTPEQQTMVDGLKKTAEQQAAKAVADKAATGASQALGDVLGGKK